MELIDYIESKREEHLNELKEFLRIPSVSTKSEHKPDIERAAHWVAEKLRAAGMEKVEIAPTKMHPLVYGESLARSRQADHSFLRPLRRAARRASRSVDVARLSNPPCATEIFSAAARRTTKARCTST